MDYYMEIFRIIPQDLTSYVDRQYDKTPIAHAELPYMIQRDNKKYTGLI